DHVAVTWIGRDDATPLGDEATGGRLALPVWREAMAVVSAARPPRAFEPPAGVVARSMDRRTGARACILRDSWYAPPRCSGFWIFESCTPAGFRDAPAHLLCTDPRAVVPLSLPARAEPPPSLPSGWSRALGPTRVALLGVSLRGDAGGEASAPPPGTEAHLAPWLGWVDGLDRTLRRASNVPAGAAVVRFEVAPDGRIANLRFPPGTEPRFAAAIRTLLESTPPPPPPEIARAGPDGTAHVRLGVVVPAGDGE
ncbi:MAG: hypothetical protein D6705_03425, partial [Deltaproteobacteria bacterium]